MERFEGIISKVHGKGPFSYTVTDGVREEKFCDTRFFQPGSSIAIEPEGKSGMRAQLLGHDIFTDVFAKAESLAAISPSRILAECGIEALQAPLEKISRFLQACMKTGRAVQVRYHNDADGITCALALKKFLHARFILHKSAVYSARDAEKDTDSCIHEFRPVLVLADFGSGKDSAETISGAIACGLEIICIDHHPPESGAAFALSANPWSCGIPDGSSYPAGLLCAALCEISGKSPGSLHRIACAGDRSEAVALTEEDRDFALALDFAAVQSRGAISGFEEILSDSTIFQDILVEARSRMSEAEGAITLALKRAGGKNAQAFVIDLDTISSHKEFPQRGKLMGIALDMASQRGAIPAVVIGISGRTLIFRASGAAVANGASAGGIIERLRAELPQCMENGGGHARAAAMKARPGLEKMALERALSLI
jgi:RecJ-like exonuclease